MIGKILKTMRKSAGFTQKQLAAKLNIATTTLSGYETGYGEPNFNVVLKIAELCDYTIKFEDDNSGEIIFD